MTAHRKAQRRFAQWVRYFRKYEPWHYATPGMLRAYNAVVRSGNRNTRNRRPG